MGLGVLFGTILAPKLGPSWSMLGTKLAYNGSSTSLRKLGGEKSMQKDASIPQAMRVTSLPALKYY